MDATIDLSLTDGKVYDEMGELLFEIHGAEPHNHWFHILQSPRDNLIYFAISSCIISLIMMYSLYRITKNINKQSPNNPYDYSVNIQNRSGYKHSKTLRICLYLNIFVFLMIGVMALAVATLYPIKTAEPSNPPPIDDEVPLSSVYTGSSGSTTCSTTAVTSGCIGHSDPDICDLMYRHVSFPGTHNSGSYDLTFPGFWVWFDSFLTCSWENHKYTWREQLDRDIRWFDIDVCIHDDKLKTCHGDAFGHEIREFLDDITKFLKDNTKHIITVYFKNDAGWDDKDTNKRNRAKKLADLLVEYREHQWCSRCIFPTDRIDYLIKDMLRYGKRLVIYVANELKTEDNRLSNADWILNPTLTTGEGITDTWDTHTVHASSTCQGPVESADSKCRNPKYSGRLITTVSLFGTSGLCLREMADRCNDRMYDATNNCFNAKTDRTVNALLIDSQHVGANNINDVIEQLNDKNINRFQNSATSSHSVSTIQANRHSCPIPENCQGLVLYEHSSYNGRHHCFEDWSSSCVYDPAWVWHHDIASSAKIFEGYWIFYADPGKRTTQKLLAPGSYSWLPNVGVKDNVVSDVRGYKETCSSSLSVWFEHWLNGIHLTTYGNIRRLYDYSYGSRRLHDMFTTAAIIEGTWKTYDYEGYKGDLGQGLVPGIYSDWGDIADGMCDNCIASLRRETSTDRDLEQRSTYFRLQNKATKKCIYQNSDGRFGYGMCWWHSDQLWSANGANGGYFRLKNKHSGNCIVNRAGSSYESSPDGWHFYYCRCLSYNDQFWKQYLDSDSIWFRLKNKQTGKCMFQATDGRFGIGTCGSHSDQRWRRLKETREVSDVTVSVPDKDWKNYIGRYSEWWWVCVVILVAVNVFCVVYYCFGAKCWNRVDNVKYKSVALQSSDDDVIA